MNRLHIQKDSDKNTFIEIKPLKDKVTQSQMIFLIFGLIGLFIAYSLLFSDNKPFAKLFILVWSVVWIFFLIKIWNVLKWRRFGREIIRVSGEDLIILKTCPLKKSKESIKINGSRILKHDYQIPPTKDSFKIHPGVLRIVNRDKSILIGKYLNDTEAEKLSDELKSIGLESEFRNTKVDNSERVDNGDKFSKKHVKKVRRLAYLGSLIPAFIVSFIMFKNDVKKYQLLSDNGVITNVNSEFSENWDSDYYKYYFISESGQKVVHSGKCSDKEHFDNYYKNLKVIYSSTDSYEFMELPDYERYSINYKIFFYLILGTIIFAFFGQNIVIIIYSGLKGQLKFTPHNKVYKT